MQIRNNISNKSKRTKIYKYVLIFLISIVYIHHSANGMTIPVCKHVNASAVQKESLYGTKKTKTKQNKTKKPDTLCKYLRHVGGISDCSYNVYIATSQHNFYN